MGKGDGTFSACREKFFTFAAYSVSGVWGYAPPEKFAKLKRFWCVFHDFQAINLMYRLDLNDNASFTLSKA